MRKYVFGIAVACLVIAPELEDVGAVEDGGSFLVNLLAGLEDLEEDGFEVATRFGCFAFCELVYDFGVSISSRGLRLGVQSMFSDYMLPRHVADFYEVH